MTRQARVIGVVVVVAALGTVAAAVIAGQDEPPRIDLSREPPTVFATIPFEVGESYTLGNMAIPSDVPRPVTVTGVEIVHANGVEMLGAGLFDAAVEPRGVGLIPGWPPADLDLTDPAEEQVAWPGEVAIVVGLRTNQPRSGLRGILVRWVDGAGHEGVYVSDMAVLTCAPGACEVDSSAPGPLLDELGLGP